MYGVGKAMDRRRPTRGKGKVRQPTRGADQLRQLTLAAFRARPLDHPSALRVRVRLLLRLCAAWPPRAECPRSCSTPADGAYGAYGAYAVYGAYGAYGADGGASPSGAMNEDEIIA